MPFSTSLLFEIEEQKKEGLEKTRLEFLNKALTEVKNVFNQYQVQEVYLTGSVLVPYKFTPRSDIDIAVRGLSNEHYYTVLSKLEEALLRNVEIIDLEQCRFAENILKTGIKII